MPNGGKRKNAGRPPGTGKYKGQQTTVMRVPLNKKEEIEMILKFPDQNKKQETCIEDIFTPVIGKESYQTMYSTLVSAGLPAPAEDYVEGKIDLNEHLLQNPESTFFVRTTGDSMSDIGIHSGDLLIVDRSIMPASGRVIIAVVNGELTVKRLIKKSNNRLFLMPENANFSAIEITEDTGFMIWGVVTNVIHSV